MLRSTHSIRSRDGRAVRIVPTLLLLLALTLGVRPASARPVANDECANATTLTVDGAALPVDDAAAEAATTDDVEPCAQRVHRGLWFKVEGTGTRLAVQLFFSHGQTMPVEVRCGPCDNAGCVVDFRVNNSTVLGWCSEAGTEYLVHVGYGSETLPPDASYSIRVLDTTDDCTELTGRCCLPMSDTCVEGVTRCECNAMGGVFDDELTCADACPLLPANDDCADAMPIAGTGLIEFDTTLATTDGAEEGEVGCDVAYRDVWYCWTAPQDGVAVVQTCGRTQIDTVITIYDGCACPAAAPPLACNDDFCDDQSRVVLTVQSGGTYLIRLGTDVGRAPGAGTLSIEIGKGTLAACCLPDNECFEAVESECAPLGGVYQTGQPSCIDFDCDVEELAPPNDDCDTARAVPIGAVTLGYTAFMVADDPVLEQTERLCGIDPDEVEPSVPPIGGLWYTVTGTGTVLRASLCGDGGFSNLDAAMLVFCGPCDDLLCVGGNIESDACDYPEVTWCSRPGVTYRIFVVGLDQDGFFGLAVTDLGEPCTAVDGCKERPHPGWNWVDNEIMLTKNEPAYWSAATGQPKGLSPFSVLDPARDGRPGRPDPDGSSDRVLRGYAIAWAIDASGREIRWNHLKGDATVVDYDGSSAFEYNAWSFAAVDAGVAHGAPTGTPGTLHLDGIEFAPAHDLLLVDFYAAGGAPFGTPDIVVDGELTLLPVSVDLRQETAGPVTTKASFSIWNQNEVKFSGTDRCVTCWDQALLSRVDVPNHFRRDHLQTDKGRARVDGVPSERCDLDNDPKDQLALGEDPNDVVSTAAALLGVRATVLDFGPDAVQARAGMNVHGMGVESAVVRFDPLAAPPEATAPRSPLRSIAPSSRRTPDAGGAAGVVSTVDRVSATEKGSVLVFPRVELRWDASGTLVRDTFLDISNDFPEDVRVLIYFVNGDPPLGKNERPKE